MPSLAWTIRSIMTQFLTAYLPYGGECVSRVADDLSRRSRASDHNCAYADSFGGNHLPSDRDHPDRHGGEAEAR